MLRYFRSSVTSLTGYFKKFAEFLRLFIYVYIDTNNIIVESKSTMKFIQHFKMYLIMI